MRNNNRAGCPKAREADVVKITPEVTPFEVVNFAAEMDYGFILFF
jgi:hypothetical protein